MKNILSSQHRAPQRTNNQRPPTLLCGGGLALFPFTLLLMLAMWCLVPDAAFGQQSGPGTAWTAGVNFQSNAPEGEDTWAFDAVEMGNGDFVVVGYAETYDPAEPVPDDRFKRVPSYAVIDKLGKLKLGFHYDRADGAGAFAQIANTADGGCVMAGWQDDHAVLTKLDANYVELWKRDFDISPNNSGGVERLYSVDVLPNKNILLSGGFKGGTPSQGETFFTLRDENGNFIDTDNSQMDDEKTVVFTGLDGKILDCKTVTVGSITYVLSTGFKAVNPQTWEYQVASDNNGKNADNTIVPPTDATHHRYIFDYDVLVGIFDVEEIGPSMSSSVFKYFNSKRFDYASFGIDATVQAGPTISPSTMDVWDEPSCPGQYGPCTPGKSAKTPGWGVGSENGSPVVDHYLSKVSQDIGRSIIYTNGYVYVAAEMNTLEMTAGFYNDMHRNGQNGVELRGLDCDEPEHEYHAYKDAYIHLLKFNLDDGTLATNAPPAVENVAHCSGGDFYATIVADQTDGKIVLGTTTADRGICGLPPIDECNDAEVHFLAKYDPVTLQPVWQQHYLADAEGLGGSCAFGLIQTSDNGFLMVGNSEYEYPNGHEDETFTIVKFTSDCLHNTAFDVGDYTVPPGQGWTVWGPSTKPPITRVNGLVTVPSGATLVISGITVEFANSKNLPGLKKCGIVVQPGGNLKIQNGAILSGLSICGPAQMWDGIVALGNPASAQTIPLQPFVEVTDNSRIENAMRGTVLGDAAWATEDRDGVALQNGTIGSVAYHNYYETHTRGGGKLTATNATYRNCGKGVVWNPYTKFSNLSVLTDTRFECTSALVDPEYRPFNTALGEPTSTETFCEIFSNRGIIFQNCTAKNTASAALFPHPRNKPSGILSIDGQFKVDGAPTIFQNLYVGITAGGIASGIPSAISVNLAHFVNVYQGINLVGTMGTEVTGCLFGVMPNTASMQEDGAASGIFCTKATAYTLRNNIMSGNATNYGIVSRHSASNGALIEGNTLSSFSLLADLFEYDNSQLQTHCNTYQGNVGDVSWDVSGVLAFQGNPFDLNYYPDNRFLWECGGGLLDIRSVNPLSYYERTESAANTNSILKCFTPTVTKVQGISNAAADCIVADPCPNPPYCNQLMGLYTSSGNSLPYRNDLLNAYVRMSPSAVSDSLYLPGTTRAITLLTNRNQQPDKRMLAATYTSLSDFSTAQQYLQQVTGADTETQDFVAYYTVLINAGLAGRDVYNLTAAEFAQLAPLMTHNSSVSDNVKTLDHILNSVYHPLKVGTGSGNRPGERGGEGSTPVSTMGLSVFPNPFNDEVRFVAPDGLLVTGLRIMDVSGRLLFERNQTFDSEVTWQPTGIPDGMLFYQCRLTNGVETHGKLLHSKKQ